MEAECEISQSSSKIWFYKLVTIRNHIHNTLKYHFSVPSLMYWCSRGSAVKSNNLILILHIFTRELRLLNINILLLPPIHKYKGVAIWIGKEILCESLHIVILQEGS